MARQDGVIPPDIPAFREHAMVNDGTACETAVYDAPHLMSIERR